MKLDYRKESVSIVYFEANQSSSVVLLEISKPVSFLRL